MLAHPPVAFALLAVAAIPRLVVAQGNVDRDGFVVCLGADTLAVERYTRSATTLESEIVVRVPVARRVTYTAALDSQGTVRSFRLAMNPLAPELADAQSSRGSLWFRGDTAEVSLSLGQNTHLLKVAARPGSVPLAAFSHALVEQAILHARRSGKDSVEFDWIGVGAPKAYPTYVSLRQDGSVKVGFFHAPALVTVDAEGRIQTLDGRATTAKVEVQRVKAPDLEHFARSFAAAEAAGGPVGQLSPRDTAYAEIARARLLIDYGRPYKRGRVIFGQVVPWNRVWRTGANAATQLMTDTPLTFGGRTVPAGIYTLWTVPRAGGATLILNRQTGQWGTEYDPRNDLARLPLAQETLPQPVEQFTIAIEASDTGGVLRLSWDTTSYLAPFTIRGP
jgi:Protein of unknown function (DUF2911)